MNLKGHPLNIDHVLRDHPLIHGDRFLALDASAAKCVQRLLHSGMKTLETGCGLSTIAFAAAQTKHITITPSRSETEAVLDYCYKSGIPTNGIHFEINPSHLVLPRLEPNTFDLILVDGCHGIPMVQVDYLYAALLLKAGGILVLDDIQIAPVRDLLAFLRAESSWRVDEISGKTAFLTKIHNGDEIREWDEQPFVVATSRFESHMDRVRRIGRGLKMLAHGNFKNFWMKLTH